MWKKDQTQKNKPRSDPPTCVKKSFSSPTDGRKKISWVLFLDSKTSIWQFFSDEWFVAANEIFSSEVVLPHRTNIISMYEIQGAKSLNNETCNPIKIITDDLLRLTNNLISNL